MRFILFILVLFLQINTSYAQESNLREFRGVWVATVANIDWPSSKNLSSEAQKKEIIHLLDLFKAMNFNAVIFQIRPAADAFYNSKYEPWSSYLTGENNKAPAPYYDPLAYIIEETHKRGMEFHAWLNPYRALVNIHEFQSNPFKLTYERSEWFINYGKNKYFNPGIPEVRSYTNNIVKDIVQNYDIDAIHFDDYFYPYKIKDQDFPDAHTFKTYGGAFYPDKLDDWRRNNVNLIISELNQSIKNIKPWVQFGVSPFGVWRNQSDDARGSNTKAGQTNYDDLYADVLLWLKNGWLDYILPQAYWHLGHEKADYAEIVRWWSDNSYGTNLYIGQGMYRLGDKNQNEAWNIEKPTQIEKQLDLNLSIPQVHGTVFFSAKSFLKNPFKIDQILKNNYFKYPILQPIVNKKIKQVPEPVQYIKLEKLKNKHYRLHWKSIPENKEKEAVKFLIYRFNKGEDINLKNKNRIIALTGENTVEINKKQFKAADVFVVQAVSRNNNLSTPKVYTVK